MAITGGRPRNSTDEPMLKMKELADAAGVAKSTILLYVKKGLLPRPVKTSPNMAYYDPACVDRIGFIKKIQASHRLPLAAIKGLFREMDKGRDITPLLELQSTVFGGAAQKMDAADFAKASGLGPEQLDRLCRLGLIIPLEPALFDEHDLELALQLKSCMERGLDPDDLAFYPKFAKQIVAAEIGLRESYTQGLGYKENALLTLELTRMARGLRAYVIDRTLQKKLIGFKGLKKE
ncbi:MAG: MerR family transcriptional regulator [Desulfobacter sp.]|nr:MerR family transcriptional regulator [Desulfobacter sp.]WDP87304.1 MAG: MerR family transcriptional regulator [Desulfobacter sp.]